MRNVKRARLENILLAAGRARGAKLGTTLEWGGLSAKSVLLVEFQALRTEEMNRASCVTQESMPVWTRVSTVLRESFASLETRRRVIHPVQAITRSQARSTLPTVQRVTFPPWKASPAHLAPRAGSKTDSELSA